MNGNWGAWSDFTECDVTCGGGSQHRTRSCNNPSSAHGGLDCLLSDGSGVRGKDESESQACNTHECPGKHPETTLHS